MRTGDTIFTSENLKRRKFSLLKKIRNGNCPRIYYYIVLTKPDSDVSLSIYSGRSINKWTEVDEKSYLLGITEKKQEAIELTSEILTSFRGKSLDIKEYLRRIYEGVTE